MSKEMVAGYARALQMSKEIANEKQVEEKPKGLLTKMTSNSTMKQNPMVEQPAYRMAKYFLQIQNQRNSANGKA